MTTDIRVHAKKSLGQNFLVNEGVLDRIVSAGEVTAADTVVEIGPGTGVLTRRLAATGARVIAVEKDRRLIAPLRAEFAGIANVTIIEGDALLFSPDDFQLETGDWKLVANIPYYLTSHLLRHMLQEWPSPSVAILMVQDEVAVRMMAAPPDMNLLALSVQLYATPSRVMRVSRGSFRPVPDVDSAVIRLDIEPRTTTSAQSAESVLALARRAFAQKRKQLKSTISPETLVGARIAPTARPQELSVRQWIELAAALH